MVPKTLSGLIDNFKARPRIELLLAVLTFPTVDTDTCPDSRKQHQMHHLCARPQQRLYFLPLPQQHGSLRLGMVVDRTGAGL